MSCECARFGLPLREQRIDPYANHGKVDHPSVVSSHQFSPNDAHKYGQIYPQQAYVMPESATEILLVRHGTSEAYDPRRPHPLVNGRADPSLSSEGKLQALKLAERLGTEQIDAIYVTPLRRTVETAAPLAERLGVTAVVVPELIEVQLGEWEGGIIRQRVAERDPLVDELNRSERWDIIPGAESNEALQARVRRGLIAISARHVGGRVAAIVHDGVIGAALAIATGGTSFRFHGSGNCSISSLVIDGAIWRLRRFNDTAHLVSLVDGK